MLKNANNNGFKSIPNNFNKKTIAKQKNSAIINVYIYFLNFFKVIISFMMVLGNVCATLSFIYFV